MTDNAQQLKCVLAGGASGCGEHEQSVLGVGVKKCLAEAFESPDFRVETQPDADEIIVENVKFLRDAETTGNYDHVLGLLSTH